MDCFGAWAGLGVKGVDEGMRAKVATASKPVSIDGNAWRDVREGRFVAHLIIRDGDIPEPGDTVVFDSPPLRAEGTVQTVHTVNRVGYLQSAVMRGVCTIEAREASGLYSSQDMTFERNGESDSGNCTHFTVVEG